MNYAVHRSAEFIKLNSALHGFPQCFSQKVGFEPATARELRADLLHSLQNATSVNDFSTAEHSTRLSYTGISSRINFLFIKVAFMVLFSMMPKSLNTFNLLFS
ncbi:MAG TPA: hypothetical protein VI564_07795 [Candidatus Nanoarchaeia archaeon]|nr:hypothetical protein [Candidatus Nanoarchaeia archaeon]